MVWVTLCILRPLEIRGTLGIELFLMNDHDVIVMPMKSCLERGQMHEDSEEKWDHITQIDLPVMVKIHRGIQKLPTRRK